MGHYVRFSWNGLNNVFAKSKYFLLCYVTNTSKKGNIKCFKYFQYFLIILYLMMFMYVDE